MYVKKMQLLIISHSTKRSLCSGNVLMENWEFSCVLCGADHESEISHSVNIMMSCREPKYKGTEMGSMKLVGRTITVTFTLTSKAQSIWALLTWIFTESKNYIQFPTYTGAIHFQYNMWEEVPSHVWGLIPQVCCAEPVLATSRALPSTS